MSSWRMKAGVGLGALAAICGAGFGALSAGATGEDPTPSAVDLQLDADAPVPSIEELRQQTRGALECLRGEGYGTFGPFARSDGQGFNYLVSTPAGAPSLPATNECENAIASSSAAFSESATDEQRQQLVDEFDETLACLGIVRPEVRTSAVGESDVLAEGEILDLFMAADGRSAGPEECFGP